MGKPVIYSKDNCSACSRTKNMFDMAGVKYTEVDLTNNPTLAKEVAVKYGATQAPVVDTGEESWSGFQPGRVKEFIMKNTKEVA